jgi:hypothetical protein
MLTRRDFIKVSVLASCSAPGFARARQAPTPFVGEDVFRRLLDRKSEWAKLAIGAAVGEIGLAFQGTPYVGNTLELADDREVCSVNLLGLDCVTLYETSLCFARMLRRGHATPAALLDEVRFTRYRGGKLDGYLSRLHYTSDWIYDNVLKGMVTDLSPKLPGAVRMDKKFDFMSTHPSAYRQLKGNPARVAKMGEIEREIAARRPWYVPNEYVAAAEPLLQTGDIVGIATSAEGLDCSHTGLVYVDGQQVRRFLNASSVRHQVVLGERLSDYAARYKKNIGIMIARPI